MKRVLLTGGNGFIRTCFRQAHHHNFEILATDIQELNILEKDKILDALKFTSLIMSSMLPLLH